MREQLGKIEMKITNDLNYLPDVISVIDKITEGTAFTPKDISQLKIVIDEACTNVMKYAFEPGTIGKIGLCLCVNKKGLTITLTDSGKQYNPLLRPDPDLAVHKKERRQHGLGVYLMRKVMNRLEYEYGPEIGNRLKMIKYFPRMDRDHG